MLLEVLASIPPHYMLVLVVLYLTAAYDLFKMALERAFERWEEGES